MTKSAAGYFARTTMISVIRITPHHASPAHPRFVHVPPTNMSYSAAHVLPVVCAERKVRKV